MYIFNIFYSFVKSGSIFRIPPITGAMHHTVAKNAEDLLVTESCICGSDYCNMVGSVLMLNITNHKISHKNSKLNFKEKPEPTVEEKMKCRAFVKVNVIGTKVCVIFGKRMLYVIR
jgi:hypothetical protein